MSFVIPDSDFVFYSSLPVWNVRQAIHLCLELDPLKYAVKLEMIRGVGERVKILDLVAGGTHIFSAQELSEQTHLSTDRLRQVNQAYSAQIN